MTESRLLREFLFGRGLDVVDEPAVCFIQLAQYVGERKASFLLGHLSIEGVDAAVLYVPRWPAPFDDERQILQRLLFPCGQVRKDVFH